MRTQEIYAVGARLLGIYFVVSGLTLLPGVYTAQSLVDAAGLPIGSRYVLAVAAQALLLLLAGFTLLVRFRRPQQAEATLLAPGDFTAGFKLLAAYFVVSGSSSLIGGIARGLLAPSFSVDRFAHAIPGIVAVVAGAVLWAKAGRLARTSVGAA